MRRPFQVVLTWFASRRVVVVGLIAVATAVVVVPIAASRSNASKEHAYGAVVRADGPMARATHAGVSSDPDLLSVDGRSVLAGVDRAQVRSLEFWARPERSRRLALSWDATRLSFKAKLRPGRFTHVVVAWSGEAIELRFDGNVVEHESLEAPAAIARPHRVSVAAPTSLREVALYDRDLDVRTIRRHERAGASLFGRLLTVRSRVGGSTPVARAAAVPGNTALPTITGTAKDGQTLTSTNGTWSGSPTSYTRAWQRCDTAGANCTAISGATATTYLLTSTDVGRTIRVKVTATNGSGSGNATSAQTATVTAAAPANTALPTITGTAKDGQTLTATTGAWTGTATITYTRQWRRCDSTGASCTDISGQTASTYILNAADVGRTVRVVVTATNSAGNASATSAQTATVTTAAPANTALPAITGTAKEGQALSASTGTWTGSATITYAYQWQNCSSSCTAISGATLSTYRLAASDVGRTVKVVVTATNSAGNASATSAATASVTAGPPVNTVLPTVSGTAADGQTLTTANGTWAGTATITYTRQWKRCNSTGASCVAISGAAGTSYTLTSADAGSTIRATWTATNSSGSASADSAQTAVVTSSPPVNTVAPAITGTAKDGQTLTSSNGTWTGSATITYTRQWRRCDTAGANCTNISGATATTYAVTGTDVGATLRVTVTATNSAGSVTADTAATATVTGSAPANTAVPTITGTAKDGQTLTASNGTWTGSATIAYTRQWQRCNSAGSSCVAISGATDTTYAVTATDVGRRLKVAVTATNAVGNATATSTATSTVTAIPPANTVLPQITGDIVENSDIYTTSGSWSGSGALSYTYQWQNCDAAGANCVNRDNATFDGISLNGNDLGRTVRVLVTATNSAGSATATSAASAVVTTSKPILYRAPQAAMVSGMHPINQTDTSVLVYTSTLGIIRGGWYGTQPVTETYQWQRCDDQANNCIDIPGQTTNRYKTSTDDINKRLRTRVTATNSIGTTTAYSDPSSVISSGAPVNTTPPRVTGTPRNHYTLTADLGEWTSPLTFSPFVTWSRCDSDGNNCEVADGGHAVGDQQTVDYDLTDADVGHRIKVDIQERTGISTGTASAISAVIAAGSIQPTVTFGGEIGDHPETWWDGGTHQLTVTAAAGGDTSGLAKVDIMFNGEEVATLNGCDGASCQTSGSVDLDLDDIPEGLTTLLVNAVDKDHTATIERREIGIDNALPDAPQHLLVDQAADGSTEVTWQSSTASDTAEYEVLRRRSPDEPFTVIGTTSDNFFIDKDAGQTAPLMRMTAARFAVARAPSVEEGYAEYETRTKDDAGNVGDPSPPAEVYATDSLAPGPTNVEVYQASSGGTVQLAWDGAPGVDQYAIFRALDMPDGMNSPATGQTRGKLERIADVTSDVTDFTDRPSDSGTYTYVIRSIVHGQLAGTSDPVRQHLTATAIPLSQRALDHAHELAAAFATVTSFGDPVVCDDWCQAIREEMEDLPKSGELADELGGEIYKLGSEMGEYPEVDLLAEGSLLEGTTVLSPVSLAVIGVLAIGTYAAYRYYEIQEPPTAETPDVKNWKVVLKGDPMLHWTCAYNWEGTACSGMGTNYVEGEIRAPATGTVGTDSSGNAIGVESWTDSCSRPGMQDPQSQLSDGWFMYMQIVPCPFMWGQSAFEWVPFRRAHVSRPSDPIDSSGVPQGLRKYRANDPDAVQALITQLRDHADEYPALIPWLETELGEEPSQTADGTPFCTSLTFVACVSAFRHAGFTGHIREEVLTPEEAWIGLPAGAVVDTTPAADNIVDNKDADVVIRTNPDPMPDMTDDDTMISNNMGLANPVADNPQFTEVLRKNAARQCRFRALAASLPISTCWTLPIFVTGGADSWGPAINDKKAISDVKPRWFAGNVRPPYTRARSWYVNKPGNAFPDGCLTVKKPTNDGNQDCDEYPLQSFAQGKGGPLETETPSLKWTNFRENRMQGRAFQHFASGDNPGDRYLWAGCNIPPTPWTNDGGLVGDALNAAKDIVPPTFLSLPLAYRLVPNIGICNIVRVN